MKLLNKACMLLSVLFSCAAFCQTSAVTFYNNQKPVTQLETTNIIFKDSYIIGFNDKLKEPLYTVELLTKDHVQKAEHLQRGFSYFSEESRLPKEDRIPSSVYTNSGYDKGHDACSGDMWTLPTQRSTFVTSNIVPQPHWHNNGVWKDIETQSREIGITYSNTYVVTGNIFTKNDKFINKNGYKLEAPSYMYKAIFIEKTNNYCIYLSSTVDKNFETKLYGGKDFKKIWHRDPVPYATNKNFTCNPVPFIIQTLHVVD